MPAGFEHVISEKSCCGCAGALGAGNENAGRCARAMRLCKFGGLFLQHGFNHLFLEFRRVAFVWYSFWHSKAPPLVIQYTILSNKWGAVQLGISGAVSRKKSGLPDGNIFAAQAAKQGLGKALPNKFPARGQNRRIADFGTVVETCSVTAADLPLSGFPVHRTDRTGLAARCGRSFFLSPKILLKGYQLPAGRGFFKISLCPLPRTKIRNAKRRGKKNIPFTYYYNPNRAKWPGNGAGQQKKAANLFQTYCFHWPPVGGWYSVLKVRFKLAR